MTLDAGALIAFERSDRFILRLVDRIARQGGRFTIPAGVLAQVWRGGRRQTRLAWLLSRSYVDVEVLDQKAARLVGMLCGIAGTSDIVDASVVLSAKRRRQSVVTSDPQDILAIDPRLDVIAI